MEIFTNILRGTLGLAVLLFLCYLASSNRKAINWRLVGVGVAFQVGLGVLILLVPGVSDVFDMISKFFVEVLNFSEAGAQFMLGKWTDNIEVTSVNPDGTKSDLAVGYIFAFRVLPTIIFFSALSAILYYIGFLQIIIKGMAWVMVRLMGLSGPESLSMAANVFIGQTEAPLLVKPYLDKMTKSEMLCLMAGGMATIAGGVFAAYIGFLGGGDPVLQAQFAKHLLAASLISAPAAIVAAKMMLPEENSAAINRNLNIPKQQIGTNLLDAISRGTTDGVKLAVNVGAMLLVFTALMSMVNYIVEHSVGDWFGLNTWVDNFSGGKFKAFNFTYLLGWLFSPLAWVIGAPNTDLLTLGQLLGQKTVLNEFFAYSQLPNVELSEKGRILAAYALCGFANFASIGIQIGGIGVLAPNQRQVLASLGIKALIAGTIACLMTACVAGMLI